MLTSTMAGVRAATGIMWLCMWRIHIHRVVEATYNLGISQTPVAEFVARDLPADVSVRRLKDIPDRDQIIRAVVEYRAGPGRPTLRLRRHSHLAFQDK